MRTWHYELLAMAVILFAVTLFFQNNVINWITTMAVLVTFNHAQIADRLQEDQRFRPAPTIPCYWKLNKLFIAKELMWICVFILLHNYAAIIGSILFAIYPKWRKFYRTLKPKAHVPTVHPDSSVRYRDSRFTEEPLF